MARTPLVWAGSPALRGIEAGRGAILSELLLSTGSVSREHNMTAPRLLYDITIYCPKCKQTVYERHGFGGAEHAREVRAANQAKYRLAAAHLGHDLQMKVRSKAVGTRP